MLIHTKPLLLLLLLSFLIPTVHAQNAVNGTITDVVSKEPLIGVTVFLTTTLDSDSRIGSVTDIDGKFSIANVSPGDYKLNASYIGYELVSRNITMGGDPLDLGNITMQQSSKQLGNVVVQSTVLQSQQNGDTSSFNAGAYKTNPDATAEDLINKMPGISTADGTIKVNGEQVKQVLVDGKPFFGDDPNAAIKNLPSEIIDKIQVFDKQSDQSLFTGFDDGNSQKSINIVTKKGRNNGVFGKISAGYGLDEEGKDSRYTVGGNLNFFNGDRRISVVGLANNINQQNFSSEDLLGVSSSGGGGSRGGGGRRGGGGAPGGYSGGGDAASNFLVGQQGGITQTQSVGLNYTDTWGKKVKVTGSYFFNRAENTNQTDLTRNYVVQDPDSTQVYMEQGLTHSTNYNHRANLRVDYTIDSSNSILINPKISFQNNETMSDLLGNTTLGESIRQSQVQNTYYAKNSGYNLSNLLLLRHKFAKRGRTLSLAINTAYNSKTGNGSLYSLNQYPNDTNVIDQQNTLTSTGLTLSGNLNYSEPITKKSQVQLSYAPSYNHNNSDRETFNLSGSTYTDLDSALTNKYINDYYYQRGGVSYRYNDSLFSLNVGLDGQYAVLDGEQTFPNSFTLNRNFTDLLPQAMFNYRFSRKENIRVFYRTSTNAPNISQLQNIVDNSNPLLLRTGNPDLRQDYTHSLNIRYGTTSSRTGNGLFIFANASYINNYIGNSTIIGPDSSIPGLKLNPGTQLSRPVNLDGAWNARGFLTYSLPLKKIKSNLNLSTGITYNHTPSIINNLNNYASNYALNGGFVLGSNISENIDFTLSYNGAYSIANNSLQSQKGYNYYSQNTTLKFNWIFLKGFVFNTNLTHTLYSGLGEGYDRNFLLWNASLGYKFLKDKSLQADIYAFDILKQNNSITRTITDTYIEDARTQVLQRYFMLRLTYTIRQFKSGARMPEAESEGRPMRDGGGRGRGNGGNGGGGGPNFGG